MAACTKHSCLYLVFGICSLFTSFLGILNAQTLFVPADPLGLTHSPRPPAATFLPPVHSCLDLCSDDNLVCCVTVEYNALTNRPYCALAGGSHGDGSYTGDVSSTADYTQCACLPQHWFVAVLWSVSVLALFPTFFALCIVHLPSAHPVHFRFDPVHALVSCCIEAYFVITYAYQYESVVSFYQCGWAKFRTSTTAALFSLVWSVAMLCRQIMAYLYFLCLRTHRTDSELARWSFNWMLHRGNWEGDSRDGDGAVAIGSGGGVRSDSWSWGRGPRRPNRDADNVNADHAAQSDSAGTGPMGGAISALDLRAPVSDASGPDVISVSVEMEVPRINCSGSDDADENDSKLELPLGASSASVSDSCSSSTAPSTLVPTPEPPIIQVQHTKEAAPHQNQEYQRLSVCSTVSDFNVNSNDGGVREEDDSTRRMSINSSVGDKTGVTTPVTDLCRRAGSTDTSTIVLLQPLSSSPPPT